MREPESRYIQMEASLDELAKGLASGTLSRRKALRMLGAALVGGALASFPGVALAAKPAGCPSGVKCKGQCCPLGASCVGSGRNQACACPQGQSVCGGECRDLATDVLNCGLCGSACGTGASCVGGQCVCPSGQVLCEGRCVSDTCSGGQVFNPATCRCECPTGTTLCPGFTADAPRPRCVPSCPDGLVLDPSACTCDVCADGTDIGCPSGQTCCSNSTPQGTNACTSCGFCVTCNRGAFFSPTECRCVCPPDLPSECRDPDAPNAAACCPAGTVCSFISPTEFVCTPM